MKDLRIFNDEFLKYINSEYQHRCSVTTKREAMKCIYYSTPIIKENICANCGILWNECRFKDKDNDSK